MATGVENAAVLVYALHIDAQLLLQDVDFVVEGGGCGGGRRAVGVLQFVFFSLKIQGRPKVPCLSSPRYAVSVERPAGLLGGGECRRCQWMGM
jgi:hypothetical protein